MWNKSEIQSKYCIKIRSSDVCCYQTLKILRILSFMQFIHHKVLSVRSFNSTVSVFLLTHKSIEQKYLRVMSRYYE